MTEKELEEIAFEALEEIYKEAEPGLDFNEVRENPNEYDERWYSNHTIEREKQEEVIEKYCEKYNLTPDERASLIWVVILNYGPIYTEENNNE